MTGEAIDPVELLAEMLRIPSPSGREAALVTYLVSAARRMGFEAGRDGAGNLIAEIGGGPRTHVLLGHADTVPGEIPVRIEKNELWGRGAVDAKGPLAAFLVAAARVGPVPGHRIVVIGAVEEEAPSSRGAWFVRDRYRPDNTIIGEPSGSAHVTLGYKGRLFARLSVSEPRAHSSIPRPTPAERVVGWWGSIEQYARERSAGASAFEALHASLDSVATDHGPFAIRATARVGFRLPPGADLRALKERIVSAAGPGGDLALEGEVPAFRADKATPVVRALLASMREQGLEPRFKLKTGTADLNVVGPVWGPSIAAYGPGDSSLDHTPEERIDLDEYRRGIDVLAGALGRLVAS